MDSNHRYRIRNNPFWLPRFGPAIRLPQQKPALSCRGPMVRIHLPPAGSPVRTSFSGANPIDGVADFANANGPFRTTLGSALAHRRNQRRGQFPPCAPRDRGGVPPPARLSRTARPASARLACRANGPRRCPDRLTGLASIGPRMSGASDFSYRSIARDGAFRPRRTFSKPTVLFWQCLTKGEDRWISNMARRDGRLGSKGGGRSE